MRRRHPLPLMLLAVVAILASLTAPAAMARAEPATPVSAMVAMPGMAHHETGGGAPCAQTCCAICQALPAPSEPARLLVLTVRAVEFASTISGSRLSALLERSTPPPRLG